MKKKDASTNILSDFSLDENKLIFISSFICVCVCYKFSAMTMYYFYYKRYGKIIKALQILLSVIFSLYNSIIGF